MVGVQKSDSEATRITNSFSIQLEKRVLLVNQLGYLQHKVFSYKRAAFISYQIFNLPVV